MNKMEMEEQIKDIALYFSSTVAEMLKVNLRYDRASVEWLSGYIERVRPTLTEGSTDGLTDSIGSFLGECIIVNYGGEWRESEGALGVFFSESNDRNAAFPFYKVRKQLLNGLEDSILSFYDVLPVILPIVLGNPKVV
jgi:hypothetical protein